MLAQRLGARRIVCVGTDFASEDERYAFRFRAPGADGRPLTTNSHYFHGARCLGWLATRLAERGCELLRLAGGLGLEGPRAIDLPALHELAQEASPELQLGLAAPPPAVRRRAAIAVLRHAEAARAATGGASDRACGAPSSEERWQVFAPLGQPEREARLRALRTRLEHEG